MAGLVRTKGKERPVKIRRARVITVAPTGRVAMIERYVRGHRYLSVPGGRLEAGESPEQAALREIEEELGLRITLAGRLPDHDDQAYFLAVVPEEAELRMSGPEMKHSNRNNRYTPRWVDAATLDGLPLRQPVRPFVTTAALAVSATVSVLPKDVLQPSSARVAKGAVPDDVVSGVPEEAAVEIVVAEVQPALSGETVIDLTTTPVQALELSFPEPRAEADPASATFVFRHALRRRLGLRSRRHPREDRLSPRN